MDTRYELRADDGTPLIGFATLDAAIEHSANLEGSQVWLLQPDGTHQQLNWDVPEDEREEVRPEVYGPFSEALRHLATCLALRPPWLLTKPKPSD